MRKSAAAIWVPALIALAACTSTPPASPSSEPSPGTVPSATASGTASAPSPSVSPIPSKGGATLASGAALPACAPRAPQAADTVTFVAEGHAWALSPSGANLTCLFPVSDAGPFEWGPLGDRVLLGGLEVKGVAGGPSLAASGQTFAAITWSRPTGKTIVYAPAGDLVLQKVSVDGSPPQDVTPLPGSKYLSVTYHPSGNAYAFAMEREGAQSIAMSTNTGKTPVQLVFSTVGTKFGAIGFEADGKHLLYAAQHADNHAEVRRIAVTDTAKAPVMWDGPVGRMVLDIRPGLQTGTFAWTTGTSCADSTAMAQSPAGTVTALPDAAGPTRAVGWLSATQLLVATGGCSGPLDLSAVDVVAGSIAPLVSGVSVTAVRTPVPTPRLHCQERSRPWAAVSADELEKRPVGRYLTWPSSQPRGRSPSPGSTAPRRTGSPARSHSVIPPATLTTSV